MTTLPPIGFAGFCEAAVHIAKGLRELGDGAISACDISDEPTPARSNLIRERARDSAVNLAGSNELPAKRSEYFEAFPGLDWRQPASCLIGDASGNKRP